MLPQRGRRYVQLLRDPLNAEARGEHYPYARYTGEKAAENDPFALRLDAPGKDGKPSSLKEIYLDAEAETGYLRDRNVFGDHISIEDTIAVMARYHNGVILNYSLLAYCPWEGERAVINGTRGQVELFARGKGHVIRGQSDADLAREQYTGEKYVRLQRMFEPPIDVEVPEVKGGHGGADAGILERVFLPDELRPEDPLGRDSSHYDGAASLLMGFGANRSIETGQPVETDTLMKLGAKPLAASMA